MKRVILLIFLISYPLLLIYPYWEWTPETGRWINPKYAPKPTPEEQWKYAMGFYNQKEWEKALREFRKLVKYYPRSSHAPEAQFMIGDCLEKLGKLYEAAKEYQKVFEKYPETKRWEEILLRQKKIADKFFEERSEGFLHRSKEWFTKTHWEKAGEIYRMILRNAPYWEKADEIKFRIGECFLNAGKFEEAVKEFEELIRDYPSSSLVEKASYYLCLCWVKKSEKYPNDADLREKAEKSLKEFIAQHPNSRFLEEAERTLRKVRNNGAKMLYDIAKFYEKQGDYTAAILYYEEAFKKFPDTYWGQKANRKKKWLKNFFTSSSSS